MNLLLVYFVLPVSLKHSRPIIVEMISMYNINNIYPVVVVRGYNSTVVVVEDS